MWDIGVSGRRWFILETNYDHWKPPPVTDNRRALANHCMDKMRQQVSFLYITTTTVLCFCFLDLLQVRSDLPKPNLWNLLGSFLHARCHSPHPGNDVVPVGIRADALVQQPYANDESLHQNVHL